MPHLFLAMLGLISLALGACAPYPLHSRMSDAEVRAVLDQHFSRGQPRAQVEQTLDQLRIPAGRRLFYPAQGARPDVLLARIFEAGGPWIDQEDDTLEFVDVSFIFDPPDSLSRWPIYRDNVRYFQGEPIYGPRRAPMRGTGRWPINIPPPIDPLEGAH